MGTFQVHVDGRLAARHQVQLRLGLWRSVPETISIPPGATLDFEIVAVPSLKMLLFWMPSDVLRLMGEVEAAARSRRGFQWRTVAVRLALLTAGYLATTGFLLYRLWEHVPAYVLGWLTGRSVGTIYIPAALTVILTGRRSSELAWRLKTGGLIFAAICFVALILFVTGNDAARAGFVAATIEAAEASMNKR